MEKARSSILDEIKDVVGKDITPSDNTYCKSQSNVESSSVVMNGVTFRFRTIRVIKERDGISIPHIIK